MGCRWCVHWVTDDRYSKDKGQIGECRRYPKPEQTTSEYRCGEFVCEPDHWEEPRGSNLMNAFFQRMHEAVRERDAERAKRIELEKKLKALSKKTANAELTWPHDATERNQ